VKVSYYSFFVKKEKVPFPVCEMKILDVPKSKFLRSDKCTLSREQDFANAITVPVVNLHK